MSEEALSCIQQHVDRFRADDFFPEARDRAALLTLLKPRKGLYDRLSEMHDCGLLGRVFPEFQAISWRVVRDFYHKYTVDEHTLLTIRNLERISTTEVPYRLRFRNILGEIDRPELLVLSLLLHDVGKWRDDDHALESVRMAVEAVERLQLDADARETVLFLIRHHLRMSLVAFRRDTEDPEIVKDFSAFIGNEERLKMLHADDAGGRRSGQPGDADVVEGGAALAALRRHLQPPDAALRRRGHRAQPGRVERSAEAAARRSHRDRDHAIPRRACRSATFSSSRAT